MFGYSGCEIVEWAFLKFTNPSVPRLAFKVLWLAAAIRLDLVFLDPLQPGRFANWDCEQFFRLDHLSRIAGVVTGEFCAVFYKYPFPPQRLQV